MPIESLLLKVCTIIYSGPKTQLIEFERENTADIQKSFYTYPQCVVEDAIVLGSYV